MSQKFNMKQINSDERRIILHSDVSEMLQLHYLKKTNIRFGLKVCDACVTFSSEIKKNEMIVTSEVAKELALPLFPLYDIIFKKNELLVGPYIGILAAKDKDELEEKVMKLGRYVRRYQEIGGLIIAFSSDCVDIEKRTVSGYVYDQTEDDWKRGEYSYPLAIFRKSYLPPDLKLHFQSILGDNIFNASRFDKWEMYDWLKDFTHIQPHLPETALYESLGSITALLGRYPAVYIKPTKGMQGKRVAKVEIQQTGKIFAQMIMKGEKEKYSFDNLKDFEQFIQENFIPGNYIVQQALDLHLKPNSIVDFRVILVKDQTGCWKNYGIVGRNGVTGNIVSNRHRGGKIEMADDTLSKIFSPEKAVDYSKKMESLSIEIALAIEQCGLHFGKFGIDLGIDTKGHLWLIEINHRNPNDFVATFAGNKGLVNKIRLANLLYAKRLAGFH